jgi:hypothetical protein
MSGNRYQQRSAGPKQISRSLQSSRIVRDVLQDVEHSQEIEADRKRSLVCTRLNERYGTSLSRVQQSFCVEIESHDLTILGYARERAEDVSCAASNLENGRCLHAGEGIFSEHFNESVSRTKPEVCVLRFE